METAGTARQLLQQSRDGTSAERAAAEEGYALLGYTLDDLDSAPALMETHARAMAIARAKTGVERTLPPELAADPTAVRSAISAYVADLRSKAHIEIFVDYAPD
jgi:hypothetical protein